jgi:hypothetical protein
VNCHDAHELFSARADDALAPEERRPEAHSPTAPTAGGAGALRATVALLHAVEPARAPVGFVERVVAAAHPEPWHAEPPAPPRLAAGLAPADRGHRRRPGRADGRLPLPRLGAGAGDAVRAARPDGGGAAGADAPAPRAAPSAKIAPPAKKEQPPARDVVRPLAKVPARCALPAATTAPAAPAAPPATAAQEAERSELRARGFESAPSASASRGRRGRAKTRPPPARLGVAGRVSAPPDVSGTLTVTDREAPPERHRVAARLGAMQVGRRADAAGVELEVVVPAARYPELTEGLSRIGRWQPERQPAVLPPEVRVVLRLVAD